VFSIPIWDPPSVRRARAIVTGRVQGVSYRAATASEARRLGVVGWVRNRADGSVELEVEGPDDRVAALLAWCEHGPPEARVARVAAEERPPTGDDTAFVVRR
jgi:acylphosphatase